MTAFMTALLVNAAVFSALFGVMLLVRALTGKRLSALLRYALWAVVIVKLLIPFGFESALSPLSWVPDAPAQVQTVFADSQSDGTDTPTAQAEPIKAEVSSADISTAGTVNSGVIDDASQVSATVEAVQPQAANRPALGWAEWAFIAWAAGCAGYAFWLLVCHTQIRRRVRRHALLPPEHMSALLEQCQEELGLHRPIRLLLQSAVDVPAVTGMFSPLLIVPASLADADDDTLRHVFLHELTHYKRGDLVTLALLNLLSCVYWFNPLIWLCFRLVRRDMETVCDQRVMQRLNQDARSAYVKTVLHFAGAAANRKLAAALSINDGRFYMEKRIHNMFRTHRTGLRTRVLSICVAVLMLAVCVLTACQPADKNHIFIDDLAHSKYAANVSEDVKSQANVTVRIDADVEGADIKSLPIYTFEQGRLTQENLDRLADCFLPNDSSYYVLSKSRSYDYTKQEIQTRITQVKAMLEEAKSMSDAEFEETYYPWTRDKLYDFYEQYIPSLEAELQRVPDEITYTRLTGGLHLWYETNTVYTDLEDGRTASIGGDVYYMGYSANALDYVDGHPSYSQQPVGVSITQQQAVDTVKDMLNKLGIDGMALSGVSVGDIYHSDQVREFISAPLPGEPADAQCWVIVFNRDQSDILVSSIWGTSLENIAGTPEEVMQIPYSTEQITVTVNDIGVLSFGWSSPIEVTGIKTQSAQLVSFDDILNSALNEMYYCIDPIQGFDTTVNIHTIRLRYAMVKDNDGDNVLTPVWDFIGDITRSDGTTSYTIEQNRTFLSINALTGSVVNFEWVQS